MAATSASTIIIIDNIDIVLFDLKDLTSAFKHVAKFSCIFISCSFNSPGISVPVNFQINDYPFNVAGISCAEFFIKKHTLGSMSLINVEIKCLFTFYSQAIHSFCSFTRFL